MIWYECLLLVCLQESTSEADERYLLCPAALTIGHLKKYVKLKFALDRQLAVRYVISRAPAVFQIQFHGSNALEA